jgi:tetratricopeptide (TPR) repeat protein
MMGDIEDQGDVHLLASEYDEAKDYYIDRISKNEANANNYYKLANVQKECGEIEEAEQNGMKCLQMMTDQLDLNDR